MPTVLITGANRGIGLEFTRQYAADGWTVYATLRDPAKAGPLEEVRGDVSVAALDVTDGASVSALAERMRGVALDLLINNAGFYGPRGVRLGSLDYATWMQVLNTNTLGPIRVTEAFLDHLRAGRQKKIIAMTSKVGSIADNTSGGTYFYRSSKTALNAAMKSVSIDLSGEGFIAAVLHPGWVKTEMGGPGALITPEQSVTGMRAVIDGLTPADSGRFLNYDGREIPW